jgi:phosphate transport system protein
MSPSRSNEHIVRAFGQELEEISNIIIRMGGVAEAQVEAAAQAVVRRDAAMATQVIQADHQLDQLQQDIDNETLRLLALRQPMASDLREILAAVKIASNIERIGDYASNIAKRALALAQVPPVRPASAVPRMDRLVQEIMKDVFDAYVDRDVAKAVAARQRDEELDELYTSLFREVLTYMMEDPRNITACAHLLFIAKNLERIGDHATNIAETIYYLVVGQPLTVARPKGDQSSFVSVPVAGTVAVVAEPRPPGERSARSAG